MSQLSEEGRYKGTQYRVNQDRHKPSAAKFCTFTGENLDVVSVIEVEVEYGGQRSSQELVVVEGGGGGGSLLVASDPQKVNGNVNNQLECVLRKHASLFEPGLGTVMGVQATSRCKPIFCRPRLVPFSIRQKVEGKNKRQVAEGILEPVQFSEWATPVVPVLKKGGTVRLYRDYKLTVNRAINTGHISRVDGSTIFSKLNLAHVYQLVMLNEESQKMTTINTLMGLFRVKQLPFGVASAPSTFQRIMETFLQGIPRSAVYIDDILVSGKHKEDHLQKLDAVQTRLEEAGLQLKRVPRLPHIWQGYAAYIGERRSCTEGPCTSLRVSAEVVPQTCELLQKMSVLSPLYWLLKNKEAKWTLGEEQQKSFESLKALLTSDRFY